jgi:hypothetical protein
VGGWLALIPLRWQIYALVAAAFVFGIFGMRAYWVDGALAKAEAKRNEARLRAVKKASEVRRDVEGVDDAGLADRASRWLRKGP